MAETGGGARGQCAVCGLECVLACSRCLVVFYCGAAHQREHWPQHRKNCTCYAVRSSETLGRHLVATRNIRKGTVIIKEKALVVYPSIEVESPEKSTACPNCCVKVTSMCDLEWGCRACLLPLCSETCLEEMGAKGLHSAEECALLAQAARRPLVSGSPEFAYIFTVRLIRCLQLTGRKGKFFRSLESHSQLDGLKRNPHLWNVLNVELSHLDFAFGALNTNAFQYECKTWNIECAVLLENISFCAHSCVPNARMVPLMKEKGDFSGALVATQDIPAGGVIFISYVEGFYPNHMRIAKLEKDKNFRCRCPRCEDPTELGTNYTSLCCSRCQRRRLLSILVPDSSEHDAKCRCRTCGFQMTNLEMVKYIESIFNLHKAAGYESSLGPAVQEDFLKRNLYPNGLFSKNVAVVVFVKRKLVYCIYGHCPGYLLSEMTMDQLDRKLTLCRELLEVVQVLSPGLSRERGALLCETVGTLVEKARRTIGADSQEAQGYAEEAAAFLLDIQVILIEPDKQGDVRKLCEDVQNVRKNIERVMLLK